MVPTLKRLIPISSNYGAIDIGSAAKYTWPMIKPVRYGRGIQLRQTSDNVFGIYNLTKSDLRYKDMLKDRLYRWAPVDTGRLRSSYRVFEIEKTPGYYIMAIINRVWYFKFPYHYYRGEIRWNRRFIMDFVESPVSEYVNLIGG